MTASPRYALYFTPSPETQLQRLGSAVIGYDVYEAQPVAHIPLDTISPEALSTGTAAPRVYGFHATLKAPFRLAEGTDRDGLRAALHDFAANCKPVAAFPVSVGELGPFLALVPDPAPPELNVIAAEIVAAFDRFRAPLNEHEIARRRVDDLTARQKYLLDRWGYPYVFDEFRFHMTLTGPLPDDKRPAWRAALAALLVDAGPVAIDALTLVEQPDPHSFFRVVERVPLRGTE